MNPSLLNKLEHLGEREEEINALLAESDAFENRDRYRDLTIELSDIEPVVRLYREFRSIGAELDQTREMLRDGDPEIRELAGQELPRLTEELESTEARLQTLLLPKDPNDEKNVIVEIRAGTTLVSVRNGRIDQQVELGRGPPRRRGGVGGGWRGRVRRRRRQRRCCRLCWRWEWAGRV